MRTSLLLLFLLSPLFAKTTTPQLLKMIKKQSSLPDISLQASTRGGYGTPEMFDAEPQLDAKASLLCNVSLLSTAEIRRRNQLEEKRSALALSYLSEILIAEKFIGFLKRQRTAYQKRRTITQKRITKGFSEQSEIFPIERHLIDVQTKINQERAKILKAQLAFAGLGGDNWKSLFDAVKKWDRKL